MMKRRLFLKIFGMAALYMAIFVLLAFIQFDDHSRFSRHIGALHISGSIDRQKTGQTQTVGTQVYAVKGGMKMVFAGMEFYLSGETDNGFAYLDNNGSKTAAYLETMTISTNEVRFHLSSDQELSFSTSTENNGRGLVISALLTGDVEQILVPFNPVYRAALKRNELGALTVGYKGFEYTFETNESETIDENNNLIFLSKSDPVVFYRVIPLDDEFNFASFIVSGSMERALYNNIAQKWLDVAFSNWEQRINTADADEDVVTAYLAEAARRGVLKQAADMIPPASGRNLTRTFQSAPFLGGLNTHLRDFTASERARTSAIDSYARTGLSAYLTEEKIFEYLTQRADMELFERGIEYIATLNPSDVDFNMCAGIFEGWLTWNGWQGNDNNPFDPLLKKAFALISSHIRKDSGNTSVFVAGETVDVLYNIRLGTALIAYGEAVMNNGWAAVGRSLVISVLSFADSDASIVSRIEMSNGGDFIKVPSANTFSAAQIYREIGLSEFYPHAVGLETEISGLWIWTASPDIDASFQNNALNLYASFSLDDTNYMYIFNVPSFRGIQMRGMDYRSDPRFETYDAPGWLYSAAERTLMLKMVQQSPIEHIRIIF